MRYTALIRVQLDEPSSSYARHTGHALAQEINDRCCCDAAELVSIDEVPEAEVGDITEGAAESARECSPHPDGGFYVEPGDKGD